jgi:hypothetical protein
MEKEIKAIVNKVENLITELKEKDFEEKRIIQNNCEHDFKHVDECCISYDICECGKQKNIVYKCSK